MHIHNYQYYLSLSLTLYIYIVMKAIQYAPSPQWFRSIIPALDGQARKSPVQCCLNTLWTKSHRSKPYSMLSERLQTKLH